MLYCIVLYCIVLHCIALYCIVLYCIVLYCIVLYCTSVSRPVVRSPIFPSLLEGSDTGSRLTLEAGKAIFAGNSLFFFSYGTGSLHNMKSCTSNAQPKMTLGTDDSDDNEDEEDSLKKDPVWRQTPAGLQRLSRRTWRTR